MEGEGLEGEKTVEEMRQTETEGKRARKILLRAKVRVGVRVGVRVRVSHMKEMELVIPFFVPFEIPPYTPTTTTVMMRKETVRNIHYFHHITMEPVEKKRSEEFPRCHPTIQRVYRIT